MMRLKGAPVDHLMGYCFSLPVIGLRTDREVMNKVAVVEVKLVLIEVSSVLE